VGEYAAILLDRTTLGHVPVRWPLIWFQHFVALETSRCRATALGYMKRDAPLPGEAALKYLLWFSQRPFPYGLPLL